MNAPRVRARRHNARDPHELIALADIGVIGMRPTQKLLIASESATLQR
jgi:hypothetical protein